MIRKLRNPLDPSHLRVVAALSMQYGVAFLQRWFARHVEGGRFHADAMDGDSMRYFVQMALLPFMDSHEPRCRALPWMDGTLVNKRPYALLLLWQWGCHKMFKKAVTHMYRTDGRVCGSNHADMARLLEVMMTKEMPWSRFCVEPLWLVFAHESRVYGIRHKSVVQHMRPSTWRMMGDLAPLRNELFPAYFTDIVMGKAMQCVTGHGYHAKNEAVLDLVIAIRGEQWALRCMAENVYQRPQPTPYAWWLMKLRGIVLRREQYAYMINHAVMINQAGALAQMLNKMCRTGAYDHPVPILLGMLQEKDAAAVKGPPIGDRVTILLRECIKQCAVGRFKQTTHDVVHLVAYFQELTFKSAYTLNGVMAAHPDIKAKLAGLRKRYRKVHKSWAELRALVERVAPRVDSNEIKSV